jgi:hypothetical protein
MDDWGNWRLNFLSREGREGGEGKKLLPSAFFASFARNKNLCLLYHYPVPPNLARPFNLCFIAAKAARPFE